MHDSSISLRSSLIKNVENVQIIYENGDIFNGCLLKGLRNGYGVLNEINNGLVYNGNWENDMVNINRINSLYIFTNLEKWIWHIKFIR